MVNTLYSPTPPTPPPTPTTARDYTWPGSRWVQSQQSHFGATVPYIMLEYPRELQAAIQKRGFEAHRLVCAGRR